MKSVDFQDMNNQDIEISVSGGGDFNIYAVSNIDNIEVTSCIRLNEFQAKILINALNDLMDTVDSE